MVKGRASWNTLNYSKQKLTDDDVPGLQLFQEHRSFVEVDVSCNKLTSRGIAPIVKFCGQCPDLRVFKAFKNEIDDAGAYHIATLLEKCTSLEEIHLSHNYLTAKGVRIIVKAADWNRVNSQSPLWLRVEQNYVDSGAEVIRQLAEEYSVCGRNDEWRCTSRHCYWKRNIHVPFLHLQRQDWQETDWAEDAGWEQSWKAKTTSRETAESSQPSVKMSKPMEDLFQREAERQSAQSADEKGKQKWTVKQVEEKGEKWTAHEDPANPVREWARNVSQVWAPVDHAKAKEPKPKAKESKKVQKETKDKEKHEKHEKSAKSERGKEPKQPKQPKQPKEPKEPKEKKPAEVKKEVEVAKPERKDSISKESTDSKESDSKEPDAKDPKTTDEVEDAKAAKLEAKKLLDAPKIHEVKVEQKWMKKGNKSPPIPPDGLETVAAFRENIPMPVGLQRQESSQSQTTAAGEQDELKSTTRHRKNSFQMEEAKPVKYQAKADILSPPPFAPSFMEQNKAIAQNVHPWEARLLKATSARNYMISKEDENQAEKFIQALNAIINEDLEPERHCHARLFGSMSTGFGTKGCDFDVVILSVNTPELEGNKDILMKLRKILLDKPDFEIKNVILTARVPILKLDYGGRDVDVSVNNEKALKNSRLLHAYAQLDPLIAEFGIAVKLWAKDAQLCGAKDGHLSSYAFILMALYFLQVGGDEMPSLQEGLNDWATGEDDEALAERVRVVKEKWSLPTRDIWALLAGFFAFYAGSVGPTGLCQCPFQWGQEVVSVRLGQRSRKLHCAHSTEFHDLKGRQEGHLHIEDPVEQSRNLRDVLRSHPVDNEQVLLEEMRLMDNQCRLQAQAMICRGQMMWDHTQRDFGPPMASMSPFGLDPRLQPGLIPVPPPVAPPASMWHPGFQPGPVMIPPMGGRVFRPPRGKHGNFH